MAAGRGRAMRKGGRSWGIVGQTVIMGGPVCAVTSVGCVRGGRGCGLIRRHGRAVRGPINGVKVAFLTLAMPGGENEIEKVSGFLERIGRGVLQKRRGGPEETQKRGVSIRPEKDGEVSSLCAADCNYFRITECPIYANSCRGCRGLIGTTNY